MKMTHPSLVFSLTQLMLARGVARTDEPKSLTVPPPPPSRAIAQSAADEG